MRTALHLASILALASLVTLPAPAGAHDRWPTTGGLYLDIGGGGEYVDLPRVTGFAGFGSDFGGIDDEFWAWSAEAALGYVDTEGMTVFDPLGQNARVELRARYTHGMSDRSDVGDFILVSSPELLLIPIALSAGMPALANTELETWEADLTWQTDVPLTKRFAISPLVGLTYTRLRFENDYKTIVPGLTHRELNDESKTDYYGVALGGDLTFRPVPELDVVLGVRADLMGADASVDATLDGLHASDDESEFAARATASLGFGYRLGPLTLRAEGFFRYLSYLAVADYSVAPTEIDEQDMWSTGVRGSLALAF